MNASRILAATQIERKRREKTYDLRPLIEDIQLEQSGEVGNRTIQVRLAAARQPQADLRTAG
jgi:hypothetical protein